jgi:LPS-assembly protein
MRHELTLGAADLGAALSRRAIIIRARMLHPRPSSPLCRPSRLWQVQRTRWAGLAAVALCAPAFADEPLLCPTTTPPRAQSPEPASGKSPSAKTPGGGKIEMSGDDVTVHANGDAELHGNVDVREGDRELHSQDGEYDAATRGFSVKGSVQYQDPLVTVSGQDAHYSQSGGANFKSAQFSLRQRSARGSAQTMDLTPAGILHLKDVRFTTCPMADHSWEMRTQSLTLDTGERIGTGRDVRVDFKGVPILYLPWLDFPLGNERKSGFLFPSIGSNSTSGFELEIPYYWNIAPNADLTFSPRYYSNRGTDLAGDTRYLTSNSRGELQWHYLPDDRLADGNDRSLVDFKDVTELPQEVRLRVDAANASDPAYFQDFGQGPEGTSVAFLQRLAELTYRDANWRIAGVLQQYQTIDFTLPSDQRPYARVPQLAASADFGFGPRDLFRYGFDSEVVDFTRAVGVTGWRLDVMPRLGFDLDDAGYFVRSTLAWRYTQYELDHTGVGVDRSPSRTLPIYSFDTGLRFERPAGDDRTLTLEPRVLYLYAPYRDQDQLPVFDTALPDLNLVELFRDNRYVGADRVSDANQVSVGVTSRLLDTASGQQFLAATLGQTYYFQPPRVVLPGETATTNSSSDAVAELALTAYKHWNIDLGLQYDPADSRSERTFVAVQFKPAQESVVNVAYRFQRNVLDQAEASAAWPVTQHWNVLGRVVYDRDTHHALDRFAGFEYRSCCWAVRFLARRYVHTSSGAETTSYLLQLELTGLASVGSAPDSFLGTAIRGYSRSSPTP